MKYNHFITLSLLVIFLFSGASCSNKQADHRISETNKQDPLTRMGINKNTTSHPKEKMSTAEYHAKKRMPRCTSRFTKTGQQIQHCEVQDIVDQQRSSEIPTFLNSQPNVTH